LAKATSLPKPSNCSIRANTLSPTPAWFSRQIHFTEGRTEQVIAALQRYLQAPPDPDNKTESRCWAAQLSQQPIANGCPTEVTRPSFR